MKTEYFIKNTPPPDNIYSKIVKKFGVSWEKGVVFTYGDIIYTKYPLTSDLLEHELVHVRQQNDFRGGKDAWWAKYLTNDQFRLEQELEAYKRQFNWAKNNIKDRNRLFMILNQSARDFSGAMYGNLMTYEEALKLLK